MVIVIEFNTIEDTGTYRHYGPFETVREAAKFGATNFESSKWYWEDLIDPKTPIRPR